MALAFNHKGYIGVIDTIDEQANLLSGTVLGMRDVLHFEGETPAQARESFVRTVDTYLDYCAQTGEPPEQPKSGRFMLRLSPQSHSLAEQAARLHRQSLNQWVEQQVERGIEEDLAALE